MASSLRPIRGERFIDRDSWKILLLAPFGAKHWVSVRHISLLWSEAVLFGRLSINISPLCGEGNIHVLTLETLSSDKQLIAAVIKLLLP